MKYSDLKNNSDNTNIKQNNSNNGGFTYNLTSYYPYGELPLKYTKQGQEQLKKELENRDMLHNPNEAVAQVLNTNQQNGNNSGNNNNSSTVQNNGFNLNGNLDLNTILPLLGSLKLGANGGGNDLINQIMPLLNGNGNLNTADLIKLFTGLKPKTNTQSMSKNFTNNTENNSLNFSIDSLKRVE